MQRLHNILQTYMQHDMSGFGEKGYTHTRSLLIELSLTNHKKFHRKQKQRAPLTAKHSNDF